MEARNGGKILRKAPVKYCNENSTNFYFDVMQTIFRVPRVLKMDNMVYLLKQFHHSQN